ncbi:hypothetical protein SRDD_07310 [Serratia sp. DD3]|nr:hypothetical protein SRDD_07310 [Serratia sp. DD3]
MVILEEVLISTRPLKSTKLPLPDKSIWLLFNTQLPPPLKLLFSCVKAPPAKLLKINWLALAISTVLAPRFCKAATLKVLLPSIANSPLKLLLSPISDILALLVILTVESTIPCRVCATLPIRPSNTRVELVVVKSTVALSAPRLRASLIVSVPPLLIAWVPLKSLLPVSWTLALVFATPLPRSRLAKLPSRLKFRAPAILMSPEPRVPVLVKVTSAPLTMVVMADRVLLSALRVKLPP